MPNRPQGNQRGDQRGDDRDAQNHDLIGVRGGSLSDRALRWVLGALVLAPAMYFITAVQYGGLTYPFWDHCELGMLLVQAREGRLDWGDLWMPHNHARPLLFRLLLLALGLASNWNIRLELVLLCAIICAAFLTIGYALWRQFGRSTGPAFLATLSLVSVVVFSPVAHNDHWWSFMITLGLCHLLVAGALVVAGFGRGRWSTQVAGAALCILATLSVTNGLVSFLAVGGMSVLLVEDWRRRVSRAAFWIAVFAVVCAVYLPGLPEGTQAARIDPVRLTRFTLVYLGAPLEGLLWFPAANIWQRLARVTWVEPLGMAVMALGVLATFVATRKDVLRAHPPLVIGFGLFAILSGVLTGLGRADTIDRAASSGYTLFGSYGLYALLLSVPPLLHWVRQTVAPGLRARPRRMVLAATYIALVVLAGHSYVRAWAIFDGTRAFNRILAAAYAGDDPKIEPSIHPAPNFVRDFKVALKTHRLGPYRRQ